MQHYVVCYKYDSDKGFLIGDPAKGIYYLTADELDKIWVSKSCLTLEPNESFIKETTEKNAKQKWFLKKCYF